MFDCTKIWDSCWKNIINNSKIYTKKRYTIEKDDSSQYKDILKLEVKQPQPGRNMGKRCEQTVHRRRMKYMSLSA